MELAKRNRAMDTALSYCSISGLNPPTFLLIAHTLRIFEQR